jgi:hypothetical protein
MIRKTTISDFGYADYSQWFICHLGSTIGEKKIVKKPNNKR